MAFTEVTEPLALNATLKKVVTALNNINKSSSSVVDFSSVKTQLDDLATTIADLVERVSALEQKEASNG